jgi:hypothetical protein
MGSGGEQELVGFVARGDFGISFWGSGSWRGQSGVAPSGFPFSDVLQVIVPWG